jgi:hypothetical protein
VISIITRPNRPVLINESDAERRAVQESPAAATPPDLRRTVTQAFSRPATIWARQTWFEDPYTARQNRRSFLSALIPVSTLAALT